MTTDEETADGIINKWNEVVSFLANIAQTDTLSGIVDGINKSISDEVTRAKKAEGVNASGISTNKTSITTLQGYFTSGSAKKALQLTNARKLWGNSFNGTADINGSIIVPDGKYISIGNIKMEYDATNKALKITNTTTNEVANLYTSGGVSAYGVGTSSSSGGGLNGSVKAYADAIRLTTENLSEIASAYSIKALDSRISSLEGGSATAISVSGSGNAVTSVTKNGTTISVVKGSTFLTSHQSLAGYATQSWVENTATAHNADTVDGVHIQWSGSLESASWLTAWEEDGSKLRAISPSVLSVKYAASAGSVAWSNVSGRPTKVSQFTNDSGYITSSASISGNAGSATRLQNARTIWGQSFNGTANIDGLFNTNKGIKANDVWIGVKQDGTITTGIVDSAPNTNLYLNYSSPNNVYLVYGGGKVGIGTTSPRGKLDVNGDLFGYSIYGSWIGSSSGSTFSIGANNGYAIDIDTNNVLNLRKGIKINGIVIGLQKDLVTASTHVIEDYDSNMFLNYYSTHNIYLCYGGGDVICGANILAYGGITAYSSSDIRLKQDLRKLDYFGIIKAMGGTFSFAWKKDNTRSIGWIAQHVLCNPHLKDIVETDENGYYKINYWSPKLIATAFGAIEQVGDEVSRLKARVVFLESEVQRLSGKQDSSNKKRLDNKNINLLN